MFRLLINYVAFQIGWLACVTGGAQQMLWLGNRPGAGDRCAASLTIASSAPGTGTDRHGRGDRRCLGQSVGGVRIVGLPVRNPDHQHRSPLDRRPVDGVRH